MTASKPVHLVVRGTTDGETVLAAFSSEVGATSYKVDLNTQVETYYHGVLAATQNPKHHRNIEAARADTLARVVTIPQDLARSALPGAWEVEINHNGDVVNACFILSCGPNTQPVEQVYEDSDTVHYYGYGRTKLDATLSATAFQEERILADFAGSS